MDASGTSGTWGGGAGAGFASPARRLRVVDAPAAPASRAEAEITALALEARTGFAAPKAINWPVIGLIAGLHVVLAAGLVSMDVVSLKLPTHAPMTVDLVPAAPPPAPPEPVIEPPLAEITPVVAPPSIDILPPRQSPVRAVVQPQPAAAPVTTAPKAAPAPAAGPAIETATDLSATMVSATPPRYPVESRRRKEEGTVVLLLTVGPDGRVADIRVSRSSGFDRLDKAALTAVKKWRWSPTVREGVPVPVRGLVEIPFILRK